MKNEFELLDCLLGCRKQLKEWGDCLEGDEVYRIKQAKEVDELLDQLSVLIKMTKKGMKISDT